MMLTIYHGMSESERRFIYALATIADAQGYIENYMFDDKQDCLVIWFKDGRVERVEMDAVFDLMYQMPDDYGIEKVRI